MIHLTIAGKPIPWAAHQGYGNRAYNPRQKHRDRVQREIRSQYRGEPLSDAISVYYHFYMPIPKSDSKKEQELKALGNVYHIKRADLTNLIKFLEDCLKGLVIVDDNQVCQVIGYKEYSEDPRSDIQIWGL
jgi:Holliday junction resolvase RusA-like endonuclease